MTLPELEAALEPLTKAALTSPDGDVAVVGAVLAAVMGCICDCQVGPVDRDGLALLLDAASRLADLRPPEFYGLNPAPKGEPC
jgi:hypothetical protein